MSSVKFPNEEVIRLENISRLGGKAKDFKHSGWWDWFDETILAAVDEKAMRLLRGATTETNRIEAQMLARSSQEIRAVFEKLIRQGDGAREQLKEIATLDKGESENA